MRCSEQSGLIRESNTARARSRDLIDGRFGYEGDRLTYDDPQNADLMAVIDRRRGLPVALGILYIHAARAGGFAAQGLHTPEPFLLLLDPARAARRWSIPSMAARRSGARRARRPAWCARSAPGPWPSRSAISMSCCGCRTISNCGH